MTQNAASLRYLFFCPDRESASGGVAVIHHMAAALGELGYNTAIVQQSPNFKASQSKSGVATYYTNEYRRVEAAQGHPLRRLEVSLRSLPGLIRGKRNAPLKLRSGDVIVTPEFMYDSVLETFPHHPKVVFSQNSFAYIQACGKAFAAGRDPTLAAYNIGISKTCLEAFDLVGVAPVAYLPVTPRPERFSFVEEKEALVTYMPRKRPEEALIVDRALRRRGRLAGCDLVAIDGMPFEQVRDLLQRSRFFISFMRSEALGFPAAEAMASGCVVVGYTGIGTAEYFDSTTGIPVPENETGALIRAVENAISEWQSDPARLERIRRNGHKQIHARFSEKVFERSLADRWQEIDSALMQ